MEPKIVKVRILDKNLQKHNGYFMHVCYARALAGEAKGIWEIMDDSQDMYENKSMTSKDMNIKEKFGHKVLSRKDLLH